MIVGKSAAYKCACVRFFTGGTAEPGLWQRHSSQLKVMHTNQWPIPYYRRTTHWPRTLFPEGDYNINITNTEVGETDSMNVALVERFLKTKAWGQQVLETVSNDGVPGGDKLTNITSPVQAANLYTEDLLKHIHFAKGENKRILKKHKFADVFA